MPFEILCFAAMLVGWKPNNGSCENKKVKLWSQLINTPILHAGGDKTQATKRDKLHKTTVPLAAILYYYMYTVKIYIVVVQPKRI